MISYNPTVSGSLTVTGTITATQGITGSFSGSVAGFPTDVSAFSASLSTRITATESTSSAYVTTSGSLAARLSSNDAKTGSYATTGSNQFNGNQSISGSIVSNGTITAQTLVVQTVTSSIEFVTGSTRNGSLSTNTHQFTGSVLMSGSLDVAGTTSITGVLTLSSTISNNTYTYTLPSATGTLALTSALSGYLPLTGGALTGALTINATNTNIQIGATSSATTSDNLRHIFAGIGAFIGQDASGELNVGNNVYYNSGFLRRVTGYASNIRFNDGNIYLQTATSAAANSAITWTNALTIALSGAATFSSTVQANGIFRQYIAAGYYSDFAYNGTTYNLGSGEIADNIDFKIAGGGAFTTGGNFRWFTQAGGAAPVERMRIASTGAATFSSSVTANGSNITIAPTTTTNAAYSEFLNAGGYGYIGLNSSTGGNLASATSAYALVISTYKSGGTTAPIQFAPNNSIAMTITSAGVVQVGAYFEGRLNASGIAFTTTNGVNADWTLETTSGGLTYLGTSGNVMSINRFGGTTTFGAPIRLKGYTVSTLPSGVQGDTAYVTDALAPTFMATVVGGGSIVSRVFYNGSNWTAQ